jgi:histidinol dehydrogenase
MKVFRYPSNECLTEILKRPQFDLSNLTATVSAVIADVNKKGDDAIRRYTKNFDGCEIKSIVVSEEEIAGASDRVSSELKAAIDIAADNILGFHASQRDSSEVIETTNGVFCWRKSVPIEKVGLYIPGGTAPLFSTVLMLAIPAKLAGCREIALCSPPDRNGKISDMILYAASKCGATKIFKIGGAQAIAAMAYGTETIPRVDKIFGPGNRYVTCAKQILSTEVAIDMPAGPSEVAILADESSVPGFVAADLLSQAEHGVDSQVLLVSTSEKVIEETLEELEKQLAALPRQDIASAALENSKAILTASIESGIEIVNEYAPEHLILAPVPFFLAIIHAKAPEIMRREQITLFRPPGLPDPLAAFRWTAL